MAGKAAGLKWVSRVGEQPPAASRGVSRGLQQGRLTLAEKLDWAVACPLLARGHQHYNKKGKRDYPSIHPGSLWTHVPPKKSIFLDNRGLQQFELNNDDIVKHILWDDSAPCLIAWDLLRCVHKTIFWVRHWQVAGTKAWSYFENQLSQLIPSCLRHLYRLAAQSKSVLYLARELRSRSLMLIFEGSFLYYPYGCFWRSLFCWHMVP